ncbi:hypothetical protein [Nakamurella lactea]|uniref:hypothetical protein n=1 Tax=Nakamurella lactea TaxID=459515 RepID=UPI0004112D4D|nr:hypothetical protein [Nakamurella lactea]
MVAMIRYRLALLGHSQRYLPPVLLYLAVLATQYTEPLSPLPPEYAISAGTMTVLACWLTITTVAVESPAQRLITLSHARRPARVPAGIVVAVLLCCLALTAVSLCWSLVVHSGGAATDVTIGALVHLAAALAGIAIGLPCSALLIDRLGWTVIAAVAGLLVLIMVPWVPVLNPVLRALSGITAPGPGIAVLSLAGALVLFGLSWVAVLVLEQRRR